MIVVLDSGIWISAFQFGGTPQAALDSVSEHTIPICDQIAQEVRTIMVRKFAWKEEEVLAIPSEYSSDGVSVAITEAVHGVCRDPKDDMVFECAVKSHAEIIISGGKDILDVKPITLFMSSLPGNTWTDLLHCRCEAVFLPLLLKREEVSSHAPTAPHSPLPTTAACSCRNATLITPVR